MTLGVRNCKVHRNSSKEHAADAGETAALYDDGQARKSCRKAGGATGL